MALITVKTRVGDYQNVTNAPRRYLAKLLAVTPAWPTKSRTSWSIMASWARKKLPKCLFDESGRWWRGFEVLTYYQDQLSPIERHMCPSPTTWGNVWRSTTWGTLFQPFSDSWFSICRSKLIANVLFSERITTPANRKWDRETLSILLSQRSHVSFPKQKLLSKLNTTGVGYSEFDPTSLRW